jgi:hypothetical protein
VAPPKNYYYFLTLGKSGYYFYRHGQTPPYYGTGGKKGYLLGGLS